MVNLRFDWVITSCQMHFNLIARFFFQLAPFTSYRNALNAYKNWESTGDGEAILGVKRVFPNRILVGKIYRNREDLNYCKTHRIRLSGPALGYPKKGEIRDKTQDYQMNVGAWKWSVGLIYPIANWGSRMVCFNEKVELLMQSHFYLQF